MYVCVRFDVCDKQRVGWFGTILLFLLPATPWSSVLQEVWSATLPVTLVSSSCPSLLHVHFFVLPLSIVFMGEFTIDMEKPKRL